MRCPAPALIAGAPSRAQEGMHPLLAAAIPSTALGGLEAQVRRGWQGARCGRLEQSSDVAAESLHCLATMESCSHPAHSLFMHTSMLCFSRPHLV